MLNVLVVGNSDGIGAAVARALVERGDRVVGVSRSASPFGHPSLRHEVHDVTASSYQSLLERLLNEEGPFDVCVYCAGIGSALALPDLSREAHVIDVNLTGLVRTVEILVPSWLKQQRGGHFVGLSSLGDAVYLAEAPSYSASKAGFSNYLLSIGQLLRGSGIAVTNIRFGFVDTKMAKAPVKPLMMSPEAAARHVLRAFDRRPAQVSVPRLMAAATWALGVWQSLIK
jgi:NAD(P)-dependent dehydrogenase (short-subunit alcohol dehydrogenase family)